MLNVQINAERTNKNNTTKPQANTFSKYYKGNIKKFGIKYTYTIQGP